MKVFITLVVIYPFTSLVQAARQNRWPVHQQLECLAGLYAFPAGQLKKHLSDQ